MPMQQLYEIDQEIQRRYGKPLDPEALRVLHQHLQHPQVMQAMQSGQLTAAQLVDQAARQAQQPAGPSPMLMGQQFGLPPAGFSRVYGHNAMPAAPPPRTLQFQSDRPIGQSIGGPSTPLTRSPQGFVALNPVLNDNNLLAGSRLRRRPLGPI